MKNLSRDTFSRVRWSSGLWAILTAVSLGPLAAHADQPQTVQGIDVYLWMNPGQGQPNAGGQIRTHVQAIAIIDFNTPLLKGRLQWEGDFNMDTDSNGTWTVSGTIELGTWNGRVFTASQGEEAGKWITKAEGHGNLNTGYVGICVAHGISGAVNGMVAILPLTGGPGTGPFTGTVVDDYEAGLIIIPRATK